MVWTPARLVMSSIMAAYIGAHRPTNRFRAVVRLAGVVHLLMVGLTLDKRGSRFVTHLDPRLQSILAVLRGVRRFAIHLPVDVQVDGVAPESGPALIVSTHNLLNQLFVARLVERGVPVTLVVRVPDPPYVVGCSTRVDMVATEPALTMLRTVMSRIQDGRVVFAAIDSFEHLDTHPHRLPTPGAEWYCSSQLIRLAVERGVRVIFCMTHLDGLEVIATVRHASAGDTAGIVRQFGEFTAEQFGRLPSRDLYNGDGRDRSVSRQAGDVAGEAR